MNSGQLRLGFEFFFFFLHFFPFFFLFAVFALHLPFSCGEFCAKFCLLLYGKKKNAKNSRNNKKKMCFVCSYEVERTFFFAVPRSMTKSKTSVAVRETKRERCEGGRKRNVRCVFIFRFCNLLLRAPRTIVYIPAVFCYQPSQMSVCVVCLCLRIASWHFYAPKISIDLQLKALVAEFMSHNSNELFLCWLSLFPSSRTDGRESPILAESDADGHSDKPRSKYGELVILG